MEVCQCLGIGTAHCSDVRLVCVRDKAVVELPFGVGRFFVLTLFFVECAELLSKVGMVEKDIAVARYSGRLEMDLTPAIALL